MNSKKSVIIDFDNTIGYFNQLIYIINILEKRYSKNIINNEKKIFILLEKYKYILRPLLIEILSIIIYNKEKNNINNFILYTKNKNIIFIKKIVKYLKNKMNKKKIFDKIIIEKSKNKNINSILDKTNIDINKEILCFIDDKNFNYKINNIKYIKCEKYIYNYKKEDIVNNFPYKYFEKIDKQILNEYLYYMNKSFKKIELPLKSYIINSKYILYLLQLFLNS
jgi:hypothetical protein